MPKLLQKKESQKLKLQRQMQRKKSLNVAEKVKKKRNQPIKFRLIKSKKKQLAVLIDPDKQTSESLLQLIELAENARVDCFFVGGSLLLNNQLNEFVALIKENCNIPVILFPGSNTQICEKADAIFFLSLIFLM